MRNVFLVILFAVLTLHVKAQQGGIVYTEYDSDTIVPYGPPDYYHNKFWIDTNLDGENDLVIRFSTDRRGIIVVFGFNDTENRIKRSYYSGYSEPIQLNDTIQNLRWLTWGTYFTEEGGDDGFRGYVCTRTKVEEGYLYGWMDIELYWLPQPQGYMWHPNVICHGMAFCTIPNYPLRVGQTSLDWNVNEINSTAAVNVHPNPIKDTFTITGTQLSEVRLQSVTGQLVAIKQGNGAESLTVDVSDLPSGLYFVSAIGEDGSRSVLKVVKE